MGWQGSSWLYILLGLMFAQAWQPWQDHHQPRALKTRQTLTALGCSLFLWATILPQPPSFLLPLIGVITASLISELLWLLLPHHHVKYRQIIIIGVMSVLIMTLATCFLWPTLSHVVLMVWLLLFGGLLLPWRYAFTPKPQTYQWLLAPSLFVGGGIALLSHIWLTNPIIHLISQLLWVTGFLLGYHEVSFFIKHLQKEKQAHTNKTTRNTEVEQRELFISLSHDMRTPLSGIMGMTELLLETSLSSVQREYAQTIQSSGNALLHVLHDRLDANVHLPEETILEESFDLSELLNYCLDLFKSQANDKQLDLIGYIDSSLPKQIMGDAVRIRQIFSRLIHNALRFTEHGEIVVSLKEVPYQALSGISFSVQDSGIGIERQRLENLFTKHLPTNNTTNAWHIGPDLNTCQQLVKAMGGELTIESAIGAGSHIGFTLPLKTPESVLTESTGEFIASFAGKRLLIVDDNRTISRVLAEQATQWGMRVSTSESGTEALAIARNAANLGQPFDVIIMDYQMPGMSGLQLGARLKEDALITNDVILLMLTGVRQHNIATLARNAGIHRVITKPVTNKQLREIISQELRRLQGIQQNDLPVADIAAKLGKINVLIAEDNQLSQKVIRGMLQKLGIQNKIVSNGREAINEVISGHYDIVLMDCDMPFVDGYTATQEIRTWEKEQQRKPIPILALTAHILQEQKQRAYNAGMNEHLSKPIELCDLQNALLRWSMPSS